MKKTIIREKADSCANCILDDSTDGRVGSEGNVAAAAADRVCLISMNYS